jgi:hypothetical protein
MQKIEMPELKNTKSNNSIAKTSNIIWCLQSLYLDVLIGTKINPKENASPDLMNLP